METNETSPVVIIKQKEIELAERWARAKQATERAALEARQWATDYRDRAEREGQEKANVFRRAELEACDAEAEKIRAEGDLSARWIAESGARGLDLAVQRILEVILPSAARPESALTSPDNPTKRDPTDQVAPEQRGTKGGA